MKVLDCGALALVGLIILGLGIAGFSKKKDSPSEQMVEQVLENAYGLDIDFSPEDDEHQENN